MEQIDIDEAVYFLMTTARYENLVGSAHQIKWMRDEREVALGFFDGSDDDSVAISIDDRQTVFQGNEAKRLKVLGILQKTSTERATHNAKPTKIKNKQARH